MNGDLINRKLSDPDGRLARLLKDPKLTDETLVRTLYLVTFNRPPTDAEVAAASGLIAEGPSRSARGAGPLLGAPELQGIPVQPLIERRGGSGRTWDHGRFDLSISTPPRGLDRDAPGRLDGRRPPSGEETPTFERDIRPLFAKRCSVCHNRKKLDDLDVSGGLALDTFEAALAGTREHPVIVPGKAAESELVRRLSVADEDERMPLSEEPLPEPQRDLIRRWIDAGAPRGTVPASPGGTPTGPTPVRRVVRSLDVTLPTETKAPAGARRARRRGARSRSRSRSGRCRRSPRWRCGATGGNSRRHPRRGRRLGPPRRPPRGRPARPPGPGPRPRLQPGRQAAGRRRRAARADRLGPRLHGPGRHAAPRLRGARRRRLRARLPARRRPARLGLARPDGPALGPRRRQARGRLQGPFRLRLRRGLHARRAFPPERQQGPFDQAHRPRDAEGAADLQRPRRGRARRRVPAGRGEIRDRGRRAATALVDAGRREALDEGRRPRRAGAST